MKKIILLVVSVFIMVMSYSCRGKSHSDPDEGALEDVSSIEREMDAGSGIKILQKLFEGNKSNMVVSGLSVDFAISMLANGAVDMSLKELESFLGLDANSRTKELQEKLSYLSKTGALEIADSIWGNRFKKEYKTLIQEKFQASVHDLPANTSEINSWIAEKTHNRIQKVLQEKTPGANYLYLVNTIFFKDNWKEQFDSDMTSDGEFTTLSGKKRNDVPMMHQTLNVGYAKVDGVQSIELRYVHGGWMRVYLPEEGADFKSFIQNISQDSLDMEYSQKEVRVSLPKFDISSETDIKSIFQSLGIHTIFNEGEAKFTNMTDVMGIHVTDIKQKAIIKIDEKGTEATAATMVEMDDGEISDDLEFNANRAFLFYVSEGDFIGVYTGE